MSDGRFEIIKDLPADVLGVTAHGHITRANYEDTLVPAVEAQIAREGKLKLLYVLGEDFGGFSAGAAWDDAKLGMMHLGECARVAVVTDIEWIRMGAKLFAPLLRGPLRVFHLAELAQAKAWISADEPAQGHAADVAADRKIPPLEDKGPVG